MYYPRTHNDGPLKGVKDRRYTVTQEYTGHPSGKPRFVLRFCDKFIGDFRNLPDATLRAVGHHAELMGVTIYTNKEV